MGSWGRARFLHAVPGHGSRGGRFAEEIAESVELEVAPLPCWEGLGEEERQRVVRGLVEVVESLSGNSLTPSLELAGNGAHLPVVNPSTSTPSICALMNH